MVLLKSESKCENTTRIGSLPGVALLRWRRLLRWLPLDRLVERRHCLRYEGCPTFTWKEDALELVIVFIFVITFTLESDVNFSLDRHELGTHVSKVSVLHFEILKRQILVLFFLILKLNAIIRMGNDKKYNVLIFLFI